MDSDWCLFCEKHVMDLGAVYCSKECARMDKVMSTSNKSTSTSISTLAPSSSPFMTPAPSSLSSMPTLKRLAPLAGTSYSSMYRSSTLAPTSMSSRGGISKSGNTMVPATASIRCLPRSSTRRQPLVLHG
ncbi:hypothetical protein BGZ46_008487 [Entomortierella lignicola]|nr:hypothetical protein BGZ46_008487 [Entomortierella lignicola]